MRPATSNLACSCGLPRPITKSHPEETWGGLGLAELLKILGFPCNISATAGTSDFKFGKQLGLPRPIIKSHTEERVGNGHGPGLGELPKIWGSPSILTQWLKLATSNLVHGLVFQGPSQNHT